MRYVPAFGGDKALKVLQQLMAASLAGREVIYFTFSEKYKGVDLAELINYTLSIAEKHGVTVGKHFELRPSLSDLPRCQVIFTRSSWILVKTSWSDDTQHR